MHIKFYQATGVIWPMQDKRWRRVGNSGLMSSLAPKFGHERNRGPFTIKQLRLNHEILKAVFWYFMSRCILIMSYDQGSQEPCSIFEMRGNSGWYVPPY